MTSPYPNFGWWQPPPCPYPTKPNTWRPNFPVGLGLTPQIAQAHSAHSGYDALQPSDLQAAFANMQLNHGDTWHMDTGASSHITYDPGKIHTSTSFGVRNILVGNGQCVPIHWSGIGFHSLLNRTFILPIILYNPIIVKNLLSVRKFVRDNALLIEFDPFGFYLKDLITGRILSRHNSTGELYPFTPHAPQLPLVFWHQFPQIGMTVLAILVLKF